VGTLSLAVCRFWYGIKGRQTPTVALNRGHGDLPMVLKGAPRRSRMQCDTPAGGNVTFQRVASTFETGLAGDPMDRRPERFLGRVDIFPKDIAGEIPDSSARFGHRSTCRIGKKA
jgi:hypothetical protein